MPLNATCGELRFYTLSADTEDTEVRSVGDKGHLSVDEKHGSMEKHLYLMTWENLFKHTREILMLIHLFL